MNNLLFEVACDYVCACMGRNHVGVGPFNALDVVGLGRSNTRSPCGPCPHFCVLVSFVCEILACHNPEILLIKNSGECPI